MSPLLRSVTRSRRTVPPLKRQTLSSQVEAQASGGLPDPRRSAFADARMADLAVVAALLLAASATWGPVFGDMQGYVAGAGGVLLGLGIAALGVWLRLTPWLTAVLGMLGYLAFGGLIALRETATGGVLPTARTFQMLMVQSFKGWKDLLTLTPPASAFLGPTVLPYLVCTVAGLVAGSVVLRTRRGEWAMLPVAGVLVSGILFGSQHAPLARWIGVFIGMTGLAWWSRTVERRRVVRTGRAQTLGAMAARRRRNGAVALVAAGAVVAFVTAPLLTDSRARYAIRQDVVPPLDLREYPSPLTQFRSFIDQREDETLMTVKGLPDKGRVRLATLDVYDGIVYNVTNPATQGFRRVGPKVTDRQPAKGTGTQTLEVKIGDYSGVWLPGSGELRRVDFTGKRASDLRESLYYSPTQETALTVTPVGSGDEYTTTTVTYRRYSDKQLEGRPFGVVDMQDNTNVPVAVQAKAQEIITGETSPIKQARALENHLKTKGYYADGKEGSPSRPGHRNQRIQSLLESEYMQGDDEQYAVAMALMARSQGMPARVVMGFYPESYSKKGTQTIKGRDAHVWVEINFDGAGWVAFDPTPPRDQRLTTQIPKPKPNPRPQVVQPPEPPDKPIELPPLSADDPKKAPDARSGTAAWVRYALYGVSGVLLFILPFATILGLKALRSRRRRLRGRPDVRAAGAWEDVLDVARDGRIAVDPRRTRSEQAKALAGAVALRREAADVAPISRTASIADFTVFSGRDIDQVRLDEAWASADEAKTAIRQVSPRRSRFSLRSFARRNAWRAWRGRRAGE